MTYTMPTFKRMRRLTRLNQAAADKLMLNTALNRAVAELKVYRARFGRIPPEELKRALVELKAAEDDAAVYASYPKKDTANGDK